MGLDECQENCRSLARRLCASCSRLQLSEIGTGKTIYFSAVSLPRQPGCNLCEFFRGLYTERLEFIPHYQVEKPNTLPQKTSLTRAIRVEILERLEDVPEQHQLCDILIFNVSISDTWYGNTSTGDLFFRDLRSFDSTAYTSPGTLTQDSKAGRPHGVLSKWADLAWARLWVQDCVHKHPECQSIVPGTPEAGSLHASTRFIDVRLRRLVQLDEIFSTAPLEYVALSYVWGKDYQLRTLSANLATFRAQLPASDLGSGERLPRTIEDAMLVTQALGYRFLWVDALCIVQDSDQDLKLQLTQMGAIYGLAVTTIAARGSCSSDSGLLGISVPRGCIGRSDPEVVVNSEMSVGVWSAGYDDENFQEKMGKLADKRYYMWRGWTFQEQILSTRSLEFNLKRMTLWCGRKESCQERGCPNFATRDMYDPHHFRHAVRKYQRREKLSPDSITPDDVADEGWLLERWKTIRETYSKRSLTHYVDRRRAILATAKVMNDIIGGVDSHGVARGNLHAELLWHLDLEENNQPDVVKFSADQCPEGLFPSWSWLNLWPVAWPALCQPLEGVSVRILSDGKFANNPIVEIKAWVVEMKLVEDSNGANKLAYPDGNLAKMDLRLDLSPKTGLRVVCVPLARGISAMWWEQELLLLRCEGQYYTRIGVGSVPEHDSETFDNFMNSKKAQRRRILCL